MPRESARKSVKRKWETRRGRTLERQFADLPESYRDWLRTAKHFSREHYINNELVQTFTHFAVLKHESDRTPIYTATKRIADFFGAAAILILISPLFIACAIAVKLSSPGPIFFTQLRVGHMGQLFWIRKFRTMVEGAEKIRAIGKPLEKLENDPRSTAVGNILRTRKFDELPQLINVLAGHMSLIGPRPLIIEDTVATPPEYVLRFAVRPGLGGMWQGRFPNSIPGEEKMRLDARYVKLRSWRLDVKLFLLSAKMFIRGE